MKKYVWFLCSLFVLTTVSSSFALDPQLVGNFEDPAVGDRYDNWFSGDSVITQSTTGVTLDSKALKLVDEDGGWGATLVKPYNEYGGTLEENIYYQTLLNPNAAIAADITAVPGEVTDFCILELFGNMEGWWNPFPGTAQEIIIDGQPHRYVYFITEEARTAIEDAIGSYNNVGWLMTTGAGSTTLYFDNIWIYPDGVWDQSFPYSPFIDQIPYPPDPNNWVNVTLNWKAAADPNGYVPIVNPDIVDQYVFLSNGSPTDPNLFYDGKIGVDPGETDPNSQYGPIQLHYGTTYYWAVVEAMDGHTQTLIPGVSRIDNVDPNNIIGPTWTFTTMSLDPVITQQPVSTTILLGEHGIPAFSIEVDSVSPVSYQWFFSTDGVINDPGDTILTGTGQTAAVNRYNVNTNMEGYYYCRVTNDASTIYSDIVTLTVGRKVAEYLFEGNLDDTSGNGNNGIGYNGAATASGDSIEGSSALLLDGTNQYVELGTGAYPKGVLFDADAGGVAGGLNAGSIRCWVKVTQEGAILANFNSDPNNTGIELAVSADGDAELSVEGEEVVGSMTQTATLLNDPNWHLLAATWDQNGAMRLYVDNTWSESSTSDTMFNIWERSILVGASRPNTADRTILGDFYGGLIDNLRVYNYPVAAEDIAQEYYDQTGIETCIYPDFTGSIYNFDNTGTSYCRVDLADLALFIAEGWLIDGFYP